MASPARPSSYSAFAAAVTVCTTPGRRSLPSHWGMNQPDDDRPWRAGGGDSDDDPQQRPRRTAADTGGSRGSAHRALPYRGAACQVLDSNNRWCVGEIREVDDGGCLVFYVDWGYSETVARGEYRGRLAMPGTHDEVCKPSWETEVFAIGTEGDPEVREITDAIRHLHNEQRWPSLTVDMCRQLEGRVLRVLSRLRATSRAGLSTREATGRPTVGGSPIGHLGRGDDSESDVGADDGVASVDSEEGEGAAVHAHGLLMTASLDEADELAGSHDVHADAATATAEVAAGAGLIGGVLGGGADADAVRASARVRAPPTRPDDFPDSLAGVALLCSRLASLSVPDSAGSTATTISPEPLHYAILRVFLRIQLVVLELLKLPGPFPGLGARMLRQTMMADSLCFFWNSHCAIMAYWPKVEFAVGKFAVIPNGGASMLYIHALNHFAYIGGLDAILARVKRTGPDAISPSELCMLGDTLSVSRYCFHKDAVPYFRLLFQAVLDLCSRYSEAERDALEQVADGAMSARLQACFVDLLVQVSTENGTRARTADKRAKRELMQRALRGESQRLQTEEAAAEDVAWVADSRTFTTNPYAAAKASLALMARATSRDALDAVASAASAALHDDGAGAAAGAGAEVDESEGDHGGLPQECAVCSHFCAEARARFCSMCGAALAPT